MLRNGRTNVKVYQVKYKMHIKLKHVKADNCASNNCEMKKSIEI